MKTKHLLMIALIPLWVYLEMTSFGFVTTLISMASDVANFAGVALLCLLIAIHVYAIKKLIKS
jgi:hypothetical protein